MIYGTDTTFLVQATVRDLPENRAALDFRDRILEEGHDLALVPQVLAEFVHIVTDQRRFLRPLTVGEALRQSSFWWNLAEARRFYPNDETVLLFHSWMDEYRLGRKRILDTFLAATFRSNGIETVVTSDEGAFRVFGCFHIINPAKPA